jgi:hypothetical protein
MLLSFSFLLFTFYFYVMYRERFARRAAKVRDRAIEIGLRLNLAPARRDQIGLSLKH